MIIEMIKVWASRSVTQIYKQLLCHSDLGFRCYTASGTREVSHGDGDSLAKKPIGFLFELLDQKI